MKNPYTALEDWATEPWQRWRIPVAVLVLVSPLILLHALLIYLLG